MTDILNVMTQVAAAAPVDLGGLSGIWQHILNDFSNITNPSNLKAFVMVIALDLLLAADNAIIVGALAAGLPADQRRKVIIMGVVAALILRVIFALVVVQLMSIVGLIFVGGLLLLWVGFKMWREIRHDANVHSPGSPEIDGDERSGIKSPKSFWGAAWAVAVADVSMSLDNVLAVAGAAGDHPGIMIVGLIFAVALMGVAANFLARLIERYKWIAYLGLALVLYVALKMMYEGWIDPSVGVGTLFM